jgi:hypothetical protein
MSAGDFKILFNRWDMEVMQLMLASEKWCNKFRDGSINFSLVIDADTLSPSGIPLGSAIS